MVSFSAWHFKNETSFCLKIWASISRRLALCSSWCDYSSLFSLAQLWSGSVSKGVALFQNFSDLNFAVRSHVPNAMRMKGKAFKILPSRVKKKDFLSSWWLKFHTLGCVFQRPSRKKKNTTTYHSYVTFEYQQWRGWVGVKERKKSHEASCACCSVSLAGNCAPTSDPGGRPAGCLREHYLWVGPGVLVFLIQCCHSCAWSWPQSLALW